MATNFPTSLDSYAALVDGTDILEAADQNNVRDAIEAIEAKVGIDGSAVTSSHDYKLANQTLGQIVNTQTGAFTDCNTVMPWDDTIPQITEGDEVMTLAITPVDSGNKLKIDVVINYGTQDEDNKIIAALFQDATASAIACGFGGQNGATSGMDVYGTITFTHYMTAGTTSSTTFRVRLGAAAGGVGFNGPVSRIAGGVAASSITIMELNP